MLVGLLRSKLCSTVEVFIKPKEIWYCAILDDGLSNNKYNIVYVFSSANGRQTAVSIWRGYS